MSDLEDVAYSRAETVAAVEDYYNFLTKMYMKDSQILRPPPQGWPSIVNGDPEALQSLGKSDEVLTLLAHLPYVRRFHNWNDDADATPGCLFADWQGDISLLCDPTRSTTGEELRVLSEGSSFTDLAPPHVFGLTSGGRENPIMVFDTHLGIVHWENCPSRIEEEFGADCFDYEPDEDDEVPEDEADWRYSATAWATADFFRILKAQFLELHWIPISQHTVLSADDCNNQRETGMAPMLQEIYRQHGWPDLNAYRKSDCLKAVRKALEEHYPDSLCSRE